MHRLARLALALVVVGPPAVAPPALPADAEAVCGPVQDGRDTVVAYAQREEHTGLDYYLARFDGRGVARMDPPRPSGSMRRAAGAK